MAGILFTDGQYLVVPENTGENLTTAGEIYSPRIMLGRFMSTWTKTTVSGISFSCSGGNQVVITKTGMNAHVSQFNDATVDDYVYLSCDKILNPTKIELHWVRKSSNSFISSGKRYLAAFAVNGQTSGRFATISELLEVYHTGSPTAGLYGYMDIDAVTMGGVLKWENYAFNNGTVVFPYGTTNGYAPIYQYGQLLLSELLPDPVPATDPYDAGGTTETGGGEGDFTDTTSPIDFPTMPTFSAVDTGFITIFNPTTAQLKSLADYMWAGLFDINAYRKIFADPGDAILGLSVVPCAVPHSDTPREIVVGNIPTGITMNVATAQYVDIDCGTLNISEYWGAYLDYSPYTKFEIYLPFIGMRPLSADDVMAKQIHLMYRIDILSGTCVAFIKCGDSVLYTFQGQCSATIPITGNDWSTAIMAAVSVACSAVATVATGGLSAPATAGSAAALGASAATGIASAANQIKPEIQKSGAMSGVGGMLGIQTPFLILTRPRQALPERQNTYTGYPSFVTETLGDLEGYTEVAYIHLENIPATTNEINELESILKSGVIL